MQLYLQSSATTFSCWRCNTDVYLQLPHETLEEHVVAQADLCLAQDEGNGTRVLDATCRNVLYRRVAVGLVEPMYHYLCRKMDQAFQVDIANRPRCLQGLETFDPETETPLFDDEVRAPLNRGYNGKN